MLVRNLVKLDGVVNVGSDGRTSGPGGQIRLLQGESMRFSTFLYTNGRSYRGWINERQAQVVDVEHGLVAMTTRLLFVGTIAGRIRDAASLQIV